MKILSIDIGTTNIKAIYKNGDFKHDFSIPVKTITCDNSREQDPQGILDSVEFLINTCKHDFGLNHIVFSIAMHTLLLLDDFMNPISNIMLWSDNRSEDLVNKYISSNYNNYATSGTPFHPMSPYSKILFERSKIQKSSYVSDLKSYLMVKLTGNFVTDISSASASGLMDIHDGNWSLSTLEDCNLNISQLPDIKPIETQFKMGDVNIHIGSTDGVMANRGVHSIKNQMVLSVGTSVGVRYISDSIYLHPEGKSFCYNAGLNQYLIGNASNNGGNHLEWLTQHIDPTLNYDSLVNALSIDYPNSIIAPYFYGERGPWWIPKVGIDQNVFSVEGNELLLRVVYGLFTNIQLLIDSLIDYNKDIPIILTGGFFKSEVIAQALCNYLNHPLEIVEDEQAVCNYGLELVESSTIKVRGKVLVPNYSQTIEKLKINAIDYLNNFGY